nr:Gag-Pol polyprotein [Tanacetum cinerariifolium]
MNFFKLSQKKNCTAGYEYGSRHTYANGWGNGGNQFRHYVGELGWAECVQNLGIQNVENQNGVIIVLRIANQNGNENVVTTRAEGNVVDDCKEIEEVNVSCILMENLHHMLTKLPSMIQMDQLSMDPSRREVEQLPATIEETRAFYVSLYNNFVIEVEKVSTVHCKTKEANEIANLNNQLSKEKSTVSYLQEEREKLKNDFKTREDELLHKLIESDKKIKELDNILVKTGQSIQMMHMISPKPDSFYHTKHKMALNYQNPFYLKQAWKKQQSLYNENVLLDKHDPFVVYDLEETLQLAQESHLKMKQLDK